MRATTPATSCITYFNARQDYLEKLLPVGAARYVSGTAAIYDGMLQMVHPDRVVDEAGLAKLPLVEPVYPLTEGLGPTRCAAPSRPRSTRVPVLPEWQDPTLACARAVARTSPTRCARCTGRPSRPTSRREGLAWSRLAYDELLAGQLALALVRAHLRRPRRPRAPPATAGMQRKKLIAALPFRLTAVADARRSPTSSAISPSRERMLRLLQGDVGSGKTVVALLRGARPWSRPAGRRR